MHGTEVVVVTRPGEHAGARADAAVTAVAGCTLAVRSADCAPVVLTSPEAVGLVHAGWRGLLGGAVRATVDALRGCGASSVAAHLGPCIHPECYEFGEADLDALAERFGPQVRGSTSWGAPALDLPAVVAATLAEVGVDHLVDDAGCTSCDGRWYSFRARRDSARMVTLAWIEAS